MVVYLDVVVVFSKTREEHEIDLKRVLERLAEIDLKLNMSKTTFRQEVIEVLGHKVSKGKVSPTISRVEAISKLEYSRSKKQLQSALGFFNYCRKFMKGFSPVCKPLFALLGDMPSSDFKKKLESEECRVSFENAKNLITK